MGNEAIVRQVVREIMDELTSLGGMTPAHMVLITELVAVCLSAAGPQPCVTDRHVTKSDAERARAYRERKKALIDRHAASRDASRSAVDNNNINSSIQEGGCGGKPSVTRPSRGSRLPNDWNPSDALWSWGKEKLSEADLRFETAAFKDYWAAQAGQRGVKLDWDRTWKTWVREAKRRRERFKPKASDVNAILNAPKRTWAEIKAARDREAT